jgi:AraC family transcriptional regulator
MRAVSLTWMISPCDRDMESIIYFRPGVRNRSAWEDTFVDALCEPPETFTFGGTFAHVITFNAYRRMVAIDVLRALEVKVEGVGCPMEYLESLAKA